MLPDCCHTYCHDAFVLLTHIQFQERSFKFQVLYKNKIVIYSIKFDTIDNYFMKAVTPKLRMLPRQCILIIDPSKDPKHHPSTHNTELTNDKT